MPPSKDGMHHVCNDVSNESHMLTCVPARLRLNVSHRFQPKSKKKVPGSLKEDLERSEISPPSLFPRTAKLMRSVQQISQPLCLRKAVICVRLFACWGIAAVEATTQVELGPAPSRKRPWSFSKSHTLFWFKICQRSTVTAGSIAGCISV